MKAFYALDKLYPSKLENPYITDKVSFELSNLYSEVPPEMQDIHKNIHKLLKQGQFDRIVQVYTAQIESQKTPYQNLMNEILGKMVIFQNREKERRENERLKALFDKLSQEVRDHPEFQRFKDCIIQKINKYDCQHYF